MRFRGKGSPASCRAGAYPGGPVAAPGGGLPSLRPCPVPPGGRAGTWIRAAPPSGRVLSIAAESWGPVQAAAARRSYSQVFQILFDCRQPGVGLGDQPGVPGYPLWPAPLAEGFPAFLGPALGGPAHSGGAGDFPERCTVVVVIMHEPVLRRGHEVQPVPGLRRR